VSAKLNFARDGAAHFPGAFNLEEIDDLKRLETAGPGRRLNGVALSDRLGPATGIAIRLAGPEINPVRAVLFDKTADANWRLGWHQDRTVAVRERREAPGFGPWSRKSGVLHVAPPFEVLERMITLRIHLDACGPDNAPLRIALGSHLIGRIPAREAADAAGRLPHLDCLAEAGDVWAYATPILHASERAKEPNRRRVLQVDYAAFDLPDRLEWAGLDAAPTPPD
jgi:hypothetical protein